MLGFESATHDKTIYTKVHNGETVYILHLQQVDDLALACNDEATEKDLYKMIGSRFRLLNETKDPFTYLSLITNFNGIGVEQSLRSISELHAPTILIGSTPAMDRITTNQ